MGKFFTFMVVALCLVSCRKDRDYVYYNLPFDEVAAIAEDRGKPFCIVLSSSFCPPCGAYIERITADSVFYAKETIFNIVNTDLLENKWYQHWLAVTASPTTAVFNPQGELIAVVEGNNRSGHECIQQSIKGKTDCMAYTYSPPVFSRMGHRTVLQTLNNVLEYRKTGDKESLNAAGEYPYSVYLQAENARDKNKAEHFLSLIGNDRQFRRLYADLARMAMGIIEPDYNPMNDAVLVTEEVVTVDGCEVNVPRHFSIKIKNSGKKDLIVDDVLVSCNCVSLAGKGYLKLAPGETGAMDFKIEGGYRGTVKQLVSLYSNSIYNPVQDIEINAVFPL